MPITTKVLSSNPGHDEVYSIQHYVIRLSMAWGRSVVLVYKSTPVSSANKTNRQDIAEILLEVALNTIPLTHTVHTGLIK